MAVYVFRRFSRLVSPNLRKYSVAPSTFKFSDIQINLCKDHERKEKPDPNMLVFGANFSDHMLEIPWSKASGWGKPVISPLHEFSIHPAAKVFHYAIELYEGLKAYRGEDEIIRIFRPNLNMARMKSTAIRACLPLFEGMKAYRGYDDKVRLFRPDLNMVRLRSGADRSALPDFEGDELISCMKKLISIDKEWVPYSTTSTLYVRPTFISTEASLGVSAPKEALLYVITGPVGPYYPTGFKPVSLLADPNHVRAWKGGVGNVKMGSNYGPTIQIQIEALEKYNCQQVLWLYGPEQYVTEVGTMNFFMYWENPQGEKELVTPPLDMGVILPGVTRQSLLDLARQWGEFKVSEKTVTMADVLTGLKENRVKELFGAGTACVVSPIEKIVYQGEPIHIPTMSDGAPIVSRMHKELTDIQFGKVASEWAVPIE